MHCLRCKGLYSWRRKSPQKLEKFCRIYIKLRILLRFIDKAPRCSLFSQNNNDILPNGYKSCVISSFIVHDIYFLTMSWKKITCRAAWKMKVAKIQMDKSGRKLIQQCENAGVTFLCCAVAVLIVFSTRQNFQAGNFSCKSCTI